MTVSADVTPFLLDLCAAFDTSAGVAYGPWEFYVHECVLTLYGEEIAPCGWNEMQRLAAGDAEAARWLPVLREDVERRLATRAASGSIWDPIWDRRL